MTHKITREYEKKMSEISPFELKNILKYAKRLSHRELLIL